MREDRIPIWFVIGVCLLIMELPICDVDLHQLPSPSPLGIKCLFVGYLLQYGVERCVPVWLCFLPVFAAWTR